MHSEIVSLFRQLTLGVYVIGVAHGSRRDAFTAASLMQASYRPLGLALAINPKHAAYGLLHAGASFAVSVLDRQQFGLARRFGTESAAGEDKMRGVDWRFGHRGAPILEAAIAYFDCAVVGEMNGGDHQLVLGRVLDGAVLRIDSAPLHYADTHNLDGSAALYPACFDGSGDANRA